MRIWRFLNIVDVLKIGGVQPIGELRMRFDYKDTLRILRDTQPIGESVTLPPCNECDFLGKLCVFFGSDTTCERIMNMPQL